MAVPQLSGDLIREGHETRLFFFKEYKFEREYLDPAALINRSDDVPPVITESLGHDYEELASRLADFKPDAIGLSVITLSISEAIKTTAFLRTQFDVPILWGGVGTTLEPEIAIEHADLVCVGEGEQVIVEFADRLQSNTPWQDIEGTWARADDGSVVQNPKRALQDLDNISKPDWDESKMVYITDDISAMGRPAYVKLALGDYEIMTQRGCPFSCSFCVESRYQEMFGKKKSLRRRNVDVVLEELVTAKNRYNPNTIWFWDDVFTLNPRWLDEFLPRYKEEVGIPFWCYTYPTTHSLELLQKLKSAGGNCISMGIQSGSERMLKEVYNRPTPLGRVIEASEEIIEAGIVGYFDLISNSSFETEEDLRSTFNFLIELPQQMVYLGAGDMKSYPTYAYSRNEDELLADNVLATTVGVQKKLYDYYHNLYWVARHPYLDKAEKLRIGNDPLYRKNPDKLKQYLYAQPTFAEGLHEMRKAVISGVHPYSSYPVPAYG